MRIKGKQIATWLLVVLVVVHISVFLVMWISTTEVVNEVKAVMRGQVDAASIEGTALKRYDITDGRSDVTVSLSIERRFVLCGFRRGCMWVNYSYQMRNAWGELCGGAADIDSHWEIEKVGGKWKIANISEEP